MSNHTKEPWLCDKRTVYALNKKGFNIFSAVVQDCRTSNSEMEENARRIVACVNACEGISTENLEDNKPIIELANDYNAVLKQRDMLLDVLRKTADDLAYVAYNIDGSKIDGLAAGLSESTCPSETALIAERNCREAISRVKGGAA